MSSLDDAAEPGPQARTRRLLIDAAHELPYTGAPLIVAAAAELAGLSRATVHRYFPGKKAALLHATMPLTKPTPQHSLTTPNRPALATTFLVGRRPSYDMGSWAFDHEIELRTLVRLSLAPDRADKTPRRGNTNRGELCSRATARD